jgi:hypothetical protein
VSSSAGAVDDVVVAVMFTPDDFDRGRKRQNPVCATEVTQAGFRIRYSGP